MNLLMNRLRRRRVTKRRIPPSDDQRKIQIDGLEHTATVVPFLRTTDLLRRRNVYLLKHETDPKSRCTEPTFASRQAMQETQDELLGTKRKTTVP